MTPADGSAAMFDAIAPSYDRLNRMMSFGSDRRWRRALAASVRGEREPERLLDVATGTGDVLLALRVAYPRAALVGLDPSGAMLERAAPKVAADSQVELVRGDALALPQPDASFDGATIAFGLRNVPDRDACLREMRRVVRPGGIIAVLELTEPAGWLAPFARLHVHHIVPWMGALWSRGDAYRYLSSSIAAFPPASEIVERMRGAGLHDATARSLSLGGAVHLFTARC
jgi:demethylmenaquinone methyltransferase / 2-methoxy-6-polyprenyl-1,4-benzoquinol methylase